MNQLERNSRRIRRGFFSHGLPRWSTSLFFDPKPQSPGLQPSGWQAFASLALVFLIALTSVGGVFLALINNAQAASVGPRFATASGDCVQVDNPDAIATASWTTPGNAFSDNATLSTASVDGTSSEYIKCTNFGFTSAMIPSGSVIDGIVVTVERFANTGANASQDAAVRIVKGGTIGATDRSTATLYTIAAVAEDHGSSTDTWGESWNATDVTSSTFGAAFSATKPSAAGPAVTVSVDYISITVFYSAPPWNTITQRQGVITNDQNNTVLASHTAKVGERLRVVTQVDTDPGAVKNRVFKLQYDKNDSTWVDVKPSGEIRPARSSIIDLDRQVGSGIAGSCTGGTTRGKGYMFEDTGQSSIIPINGLGCHDIGFVIDTKNATANTTYRFRLYDVTGATALNTYSAYPSFTTVSSSNDTVRASKSNSVSTANAQSDLKTLLDNQGYSKINSDDAAREILQNVTSDTTADATITGGGANYNLGWSVSTAGDVNGDGYDDVAVGTPISSGVAGQLNIFYGGVLFDTTADVTLTGETTAGGYGRSVSSAGDVNADGYEDVIVGDSSYSTNTGRAYIYYGGSSMDSTADVTITGDASIYLGASVASAGDVNKDGFSDVLVGATGYVSNTGRTYIYYGSSSMSSSQTTSSANVTMTGAGGNDYFGNSVSSAGDVNGDGYPDVIIGSYEVSGGTGLSYIYYGGASMDNTVDVTLTGQLSLDKFGNSVSSAGDVNGDGYADVIVGANGYDNGGGSSSDNWGRAYIFYGSGSMASSIAASSANVIMTGLAINDALGSSVASVGDVNGDGYGDVIVGADAYSSSTGRAYILHGGSSMNNTADATMTGESTSNNFGTSVANAGDVNGDGYNDVIVGARSYSSSTGRAYIYYQSQTVNSTADKTMNGETTNNYFGYSVASAGDVNGDGYDDVVVGAQAYSSSTGRAYIFYGGISMDTTADVTMTGGGINNGFGWSVAGGGDVNGDGYADVAVGAPQVGTADGRAYVYYGGSTMNNAADVTLVGMTGEEFGTSVAIAGDVNGDGYADVAVGAASDSSFSYIGSVKVYFGGSSMNTGVDLTMTGEASGNSFGASVSSAGDANGDGYDDLVVGANGYSSTTGRAYVYFGGTSVDTIVDVTMTGEANFDSFGFSVSSTGDVNGDGYDDVIVGATGHNSGTGKAYVYYGGNGMNNIVDMTMTGETTSNNFGWSVSSGDVNGDGYADIAVGARSYSSNTGRAYVYYGASNMDTTADLTMTGETTGSLLGESISLNGDVNADGYADIAMGARGYNTSTGRSYIYLGGSSSYIPTYNFAQKSSVACSSLSNIRYHLDLRSNVAASTRNIILQYYKFGSTNAWTNAIVISGLAADTDLAGVSDMIFSSGLGDMCDGSNWSYWRVYQTTGTQTLQVDQFSLDFTASGGNTTPNSPTSPAQNRVTGGASVATGGWTNENQIRLSASATDPDASDTLQLCVEKELLGTAFDGVGEVCGTGVAYSGSTVNPSVDITGMAEGEYHWQARIKDAGGLYSSWVSYGGNAESARDFGVDTTAPTGTVYDGSSVGVDASLNNGSLTSLSANWGAGIDRSISGLDMFEYSIGTTQGGTDILNWTLTVAGSVNRTGLALVTSQIYYFNIRTTDLAGNVSTISSNGQMVAPTLTFSTSSNTVDFNRLNASNSYTASQSLTMTTTTNAKNGYQVYGKATSLLTNQSSQTIAMFNGGTYASPAAWGSNTGFGYNSSDTSVGGSNRFNSATCPGGGAAPCFAPYSLIGIGDVVADAGSIPAGGPASNDTTTITNKVSVTGATQRSGRYQTTVLYSAYATY